MSEQEKTFIKNSILDAVNEDNKQILMHIALAISKIARTDYPATWKELMHKLTEVIKSGSEQQRSRALFILKHTVLALQSKGLEKNAFHQVCTTSTTNSLARRTNDSIFLSNLRTL